MRWVVVHEAFCQACEGTGWITPTRICTICAGVGLQQIKKIGRWTVIRPTAYLALGRVSKFRNQHRGMWLIRWRHMVKA